ncbi:hypothetical protein [Piscinibacter sp.]|uniref:hypothetical protein n=1 Tax=Piscinibacter sp. TaxID=1903157 RepID=UPI0011DBFDA9|nr:MAG: hypothetical protein E6Q93_28895 [Burkholderiaceae bacterium]
MAAPDLAIRGVAVLDDDRNFAAAVCKMLDRGLQDGGALPGVTASLLLDTVNPESGFEGQLGVRSYLRRLAKLLAAIDARITGQPMPAGIAALPHFLFCDVLLPDYESGSSSSLTDWRTAERVRDLLTAIYRKWDKAFVSGPAFPFRVQFWSEHWERFHGRATELVSDRLTGELLPWAHYRTKPAMVSSYEVDPAEKTGLFRQLLQFQPGVERDPAWMFAGTEGRSLRARLQALVHTPGSCVVVSDSRVARMAAATEFVAKCRLPARWRSVKTLRQLREQWESFQDTPVALRIDLTDLEFDDSLVAEADELLGLMASCRGLGGHRFAFQVEPDDNHWRSLLRRAFGACEVTVPSPVDRPADVPRMVQARCGRTISEPDRVVLVQRAQFVSYEHIDRLTSDEPGLVRAFGGEDWDVLDLRPDELIVRLVLSREGERVALACDGRSTDLTHIGQKQNAWALLCLFAQQRRGSTERLELSLSEAPVLAGDLRGRWPRLWTQASTTRPERRVFDSGGRWKCDFAKDTTGGLTQSLARWFSEVDLRPPIQVSKNDDLVVVEWGYPLHVTLDTSEGPLQAWKRVAPRRVPRP